MVTIASAKNRAIGSIEEPQKKSGVTTDELSKNAMGGTELMKYGLYDRLPEDVRDSVQIICSRVREVDETKPSILWLHDLPADPESAHLKDTKSRNRFQKLVFVSHWQQQQYNQQLGIPYSEGVVLKNAIKPFEAHTKPDDVINIIYHTTPHRGLDIAVAAFEEIYKIRQDVHFHVYSNFDIYGWSDRNRPFESLYERCRQHPGITYHGTVSNDEVREALKKTHIFAYPSVWQETSCIAAIEALAAGCLVVAPNYAALPETCSNFAFMYGYNENRMDHANLFVNVLYQAIMSYRKESTQKMLNMQTNYFNTFYNWDLRVQEWTSLIKSLDK
jgi:UDP-glucose:(glucosyl)LPS alpha-1,2-glucosyltransferase